MQRLLLPPVVWFASVGAMVILQRTWPVAVLPADGRVLAWWAGGVLVLAGLAMAQWHARLFKRIGELLALLQDSDIVEMRADIFRIERNR